MLLLLLICSIVGVSFWKLHLLIHLARSSSRFRCNEAVGKFVRCIQIILFVLLFISWGEWNRFWTLSHRIDSKSNWSTGLVSTRSLRFWEQFELLCLIKCFYFFLFFSRNIGVGDDFAFICFNKWRNYSTCIEGVIDFVILDLWSWLFRNIKLLLGLIFRYERTIASWIWVYAF